jgi:hypothetical protein
MSMTNIAGRLGKLEKANPAAAPPRRVIRIVGRSDGESLEAAISHWCKEHPDEPAPADDDLIILRSIVSPQAPQVARTMEHAT